MAEALFNKYASSGEAKGAGVILDLLRPYVADNVKKVLKEKGIEHLDETARALTEQDQQWADKIVIVANNVSPDLFPSEKVVVWETEDADESELEKIREIVGGIDERVVRLVEELHL